MAILNPDHLFDQAERLVEAPQAGAPRQVDIRRAISAAYYGLFHAILTEAADQFVGVTRRSSNEYALVYRSVDHGSIRRLCEAVKGRSLPPKYARNAPSGGFGQDIRSFSSTFLDLQEKRHAADYDPSVRVNTSDARAAIRAARVAIGRFRRTGETERRAFLSLLIFSAR